MAKMKTSGTKKISKVMGEYKSGKLHSGSKTGPVVKSRTQALAIGINEAKKAGAKISRPKKAPERAYIGTTGVS